MFELVLQFATLFAPERKAFDAAFGSALDDPSCLLVVDGSRELTGYLLAFCHDTFYANGPVCWIEEVMVREDARRAGIGLSLVRAAEAWASERGSSVIALATRRADAFWQAAGYAPSATYLRKLVRPTRGVL